MASSRYYPDDRERPRRPVARDRLERGPETRSDSLDLAEFFSVLRRRMGQMLLTLAIIMGLAFLYLFIAPSKYQASSSLLIDPRLGRGLGADPAQSNFSQDASSIDSQVKLLSSQAVLARVIKSEKLDQDPEFGGGTGGGGLRVLLGLAPKEGPKDTSDIVMKALSEAITIKRPERTYVVEIQVTAKDPVKAANIANAVGRAYIEDQIESRIESAGSDAKWVRQRLELVQKQIQDAENKVEAYKTANRIVTTDGLRSNEQQVADLTKELGFARARASEAKAKLDQFQRVAREGRIDASTEALKSPTIERLRAQQADIEREIAKLGNTLGMRHPAMVESLAQGAKVRRLIEEELQRIRTGAQNDYQVAHNNETQLEREIERLKGASNTTSKTLVPLRQLERDVESLRASYDKFARIQDNLTQQEADSAPARIVAPARPPVTASSPKRLAILFFALGGGLFFALGLALISESFARRKANQAPAQAPAPRAAAAPPEPQQRERERVYDDAIERLRERARQREDDDVYDRAMARSRAPRDPYYDDDYPPRHRRVAPRKMWNDDDGYPERGRW